MAIDSPGEFALISRLLRNYQQEIPDNCVAAGDDCAVMPYGSSYMLTTTDTMVEGVHFRRSYFSAYDLGWKLMAVNLSDVAAMGGTPKYAFINLCLPKEIKSEYLDQLYSGLSDLGTKYDVLLLGGDTVASDVFTLSLTLVATSESNPILRSNARPGDSLWLSSKVGDAGAGLKTLEQDLKVLDNKFIQRHLRPNPEINLGQFLLENDIASSMIDISDGLLQDAEHLARSSKVEVQIELDCVALSSAVDFGVLDSVEAVTSGEDYCLLFTVPEEKEKRLELLAKNRELYKVGKILKAEDSARVMLKTSGGEHLTLESYLGPKIKAGFQHF